jgi:hypothetical protein
MVAWGAIQACRDLNLDPAQLVVLPFGLEGDTLKDALVAGQYCRAGLAMFPELVGPACVEAAIAAYNQVPLPAELITPHAVLTSKNLPQWYLRSDTGWRFRPELAQTGGLIPVEVEHFGERHGVAMPGCIGIIVPFMEHEWYQNLVAAMQAHADHYQIEIEIVDVDQSLKDEVELSRREIARTRGLVALGEDELRVGDVSAAYVKAHLHRALSESPELRRVLQAIWHQVSTAGEVFAVGAVNPDKTVQGGTGWAVELARHWGKPVHLFDQERKGWLRWDGRDWIDEPPPVVTHERFAGAGTRSPSGEARAAIRDLFERSFGPPRA